MNGFRLGANGKIECVKCDEEIVKRWELSLSLFSLSHKLGWKRDGNGKDKKMHAINCSGCSGSFYVDEYVK